MAQADYDKQVEITRLLMEGLASIQTKHLKHLNDFVEAQVKYYAECHQTMQDLQRELSRYNNTELNRTGTAVLLVAAFQM